MRKRIWHQFSVYKDLANKLLIRKMRSQAEHQLLHVQPNDQNLVETNLRSLQTIEVIEPLQLFSMFAVVQSVSHPERGACMDLQVLDEQGNQGYVVVPTILLARPVPSCTSPV